MNTAHKSIIIAIIAMIGLIGALCIATPAMAEGNSLPEVPDQILPAKDAQNYSVIMLNPEMFVNNESQNNPPADLRASGSAYSGEITNVTITPERLVSNQPVMFNVSVKNTGNINTCYQLEYYRNGSHRSSGFELWIEPGENGTFSWQRSMGSPGDREYKFELYWDQVWYAGDNVLLDTVIVNRHCFAAGLPDEYEPDDNVSQANIINTNGEAEYHDFHDEGDIDWVKFYVEAGDESIVETTVIGDRADTYLTFCYYDGVMWHYIYDDDGGAGHGSRIAYTCTRSGYHYAAVRQYNSDVYGETTAYSINVSIEHVPIMIPSTDTDGDGVPDVWDADNSTPAGYWVNSDGVGRRWGDMNGDGELTSVDALMILQAAVGKINL